MSQKKEFSKDHSPLSSLAIETKVLSLSLIYIRTFSSAQIYDVKQFNNFQLTNIPRFTHCSQKCEPGQITHF